MTQTPDAPAPKALTHAQKAQILNLVRRAAKAEILPRFRKSDTLNVASKSHALDLVTAADVNAEAMITRGLAGLFPGAVIVGEEATEADPTLRDAIGAAELCFIIDPVDGTWNFANGLATFGTIIAACHRGQPIYGLIYDPLADDLMEADLDSPSRYVPRAGALQTLKTAAPKPLTEMVGSIPLKLFADDLQPAVASLFPRIGKPANLNCSAHEYRLLAQGGLDFVIGAKQTPWDHAAGVLLCQQAGGHACMLDRSPYSAALTDGYLLSASCKETWERVAAELSMLAPPAP